MLFVPLLLASSVVGALAQMDPCTAGYRGDPPPPGTDQSNFVWSAGVEAESIKYETEVNPLMPNGFHRAVVSMDNEPPFCPTVTGAQNSNVLVLIETKIPNQRICVKQRSNTIALNDVGILPQHCDVGQLSACFPGDSRSNSLNLVVYCDESCPEGPIEFYYKMRHSMARTDKNIEADSAVSNVDMWCMMLDGTQTKVWPSELGQDAPNDFVTKQYLQVLNGASASLPHFGVLLTSLAMLVAFVCLH